MAATELQRLARRENYAIFILKGIHSAISSPMTSILPFSVRAAIQQACERGITYIKTEQYHRKLNARRNKEPI